MESKHTLSLKMRTLHRYIGYFLAGVMAVYAISGTVLIFRETDTFKQKKEVERQLEPSLNTEALGKALRNRELKIEKQEGDILFFKTGTYNQSTGIANYTSNELPYLLEKLTRLHKANTNDPLYFLNISFACGLLFFVVSSFWMYRPQTRIFKKGMYFTLGGILITLILLFV